MKSYVAYYTNYQTYAILATSLEEAKRQAPPFMDSPKHGLLWSVEEDKERG